MNACWSQILIQLHKNLPEPQCRVWLDPLKGKLRSLKGESVSSGAGGASGPVWSLELAAANDFVATWVRERLSSAILQAASEVLGCRPVFVLSLHPQGSGPGRKSRCCPLRFPGES